MKCPIDQTEMEKGEVRVASIPKVTFISSKSSGFSKWMGNGPKIIAYCCPKCGKIELTTEEQK